mmetsp:Transcript_11199/g.38879  ORF Transcript_11199/g.38879 Transcript_11199/m.38879 type:complete len:206 (+) Transcript_11199:652-1269(+)
MPPRSKSVQAQLSWRSPPRTIAFEASNSKILSSLARSTAKPSKPSRFQGVLEISMATRDRKKPADAVGRKASINACTCARSNGGAKAEIVFGFGTVCGPIKTWAQKTCQGLPAALLSENADRSTSVRPAPSCSKAGSHMEALTSAETALIWAAMVGSVKYALTSVFVVETAGNLPKTEAKVGSLDRAVLRVSSATNVARLPHSMT